MKSDEVSLGAFGVFILWTGCLVVGVTGLVMPHRLPSPPLAELPPITATMLNVAIGDSSASPTADPKGAPPSPADPDPAPPSPLQTPSAAPPLQAVAEPNPNIAFALPTASNGPIVSAAAAVPSRAAMTSASPDALPGASVQHLVFGNGAGQQPAPEYPREAALAGEEGTVVVQFIVGVDGRVQSAFAKTPCRSALLNQAAVRTIRDSWRFKAGPPTTYEISIVFQLANN